NTLSKLPRFFIQLELRTQQHKHTRGYAMRRPVIKLVLKIPKKERTTHGVAPTKYKTKTQVVGAGSLL
ncbi:MAG: hypothetical protein K2X81_07910, partial [Candidatus Obscuribacterales bacterium]|nr:hypothetical protein [Candidatus Obscuribacterales bacterium]